MKNWKGFQTNRIQPNQGIAPAFSWRDQGETITNLKSGWLVYWPRFTPGTTPNIGSLLHVITVSHRLCYIPCPLVISPPCHLLHRLSLLNTVTCSHYADYIAVMHVFDTHTLNTMPMRSGMKIHLKVSWCDCSKLNNLHISENILRNRLHSRE